MQPCGERRAPLPMHHKACSSAHLGRCSSRLESFEAVQTHSGPGGGLGSNTRPDSSTALSSSNLGSHDGKGERGWWRQCAWPAIWMAAPRHPTRAAAAAAHVDHEGCWRRLARRAHSHCIDKPPTLDIRQARCTGMAWPTTACLRGAAPCCKPHHAHAVVALHAKAAPRRQARDQGQRRGRRGVLPPCAAAAQDVGEGSYHTDNHDGQTVEQRLRMVQNMVTTAELLVPYDRSAVNLGLIIW